MEALTQETLRPFEELDLDVKAWVNACLERAAAAQDDDDLELPTSRQASDDSLGAGADADTLGAQPGAAANLAAQGRAPGPLESYLSSVLVRLQQESQSLNGKLEDQMAQLLGSIPRALREVERIGRDSSALVRGVGKLESHVGALEQTAAQASQQTAAQASQQAAGDVSTIDTLEHLHTIKTNLDKTIAVLEQSANWSRLAREVEEGFESQNLAGVAKRLSSLRASLRLLDGMPGADERERTLTSMEERLETLIGPGLQDAIRTCLDGEQSGGEAKVLEAEKRLHSLVEVFEMLGTLPSLCNEFASARAGFLHRDWEASAAEARENGEPLPAWVQRFYERFASALDREASRCVRVFGKAHAAAAIERIAVEGLALIGADLEAHLRTVELSSAIDVFEKTCSFADQVSRIALEHGSEADPTRPPRGAALVKAVAAPFSSLFGSYWQLEHRTIADDFAARAGQVSAATIRGLLSDPASTSLVQTGMERCARLTRGAKTAALLGAADDFWADFCTKCVQVLKQMFSDPTQASMMSEGGWEEQTSSVLGLLQEVAGFAGRVREFRDTTLAPKMSRLAADLLAERGAADGDQASTATLVVAHLLEADAEEGASLRQVAENGPSIQSHFLARSAAALEDLVESAQALTYETIMAPIEAEWSSMAAMRVWGLHTDAQVSKFQSSEEEMISEFGTPLRYMTRVVKHLSNLVQLLEPFATKSASADLLPKVHRLGNKTRGALEDLLHLEADSRLESLLAAAAQDTAEGALAGDDGIEGEEDDEEPLDEFSRLWLNVVALGASDTLMLHIAKIDRIGDQGRKQLSADLGQLEYVISLIAAPHDAVLEHFRSTLQMPTKEIEQAVIDAASAGHDEALVYIQQLLLDKIKAAAAEADAVSPKRVDVEPAA